MNTLALALSLLLFPCQEKPGSDAEVEKLRAQIADLQKQLDLAQQRLHEKTGVLPAERQAQAQLFRALAEQKAAMKALTAPPPVVAPPPVPAPPPTILTPVTVQGKISAVAPEISLVVLSVGKDHGVQDGDEFAITRSGEEVGTIRIDRSDRKWSAGKVLQKKSEPRVADDVVRQKSVSKPYEMFTWTVQPAAPAVSRSSADELRSLRKELDEVRSQVRQLSDRIVPSWQGQGVSSEEASDELRAHLGILRGLLVRQVREGSPAEKAGLKANDVVPDLLEAQLLEAIESGMPIHLIRRGQKVRLPGAKGR